MNTDAARHLMEIYRALDLTDGGNPAFSFQKCDFDNRLFVETGAVFTVNDALRNVFIGRNSYGNDSTVLLSPNTIIGRFCSIASYAALGASQHRMTWLTTGMLPVRAKAQKAIEDADDAPTVIGNDVWVGTGAMVLGGKGTVVGHGACIGAGAVVTKSVPPYAIVAGTPARIIRYRFDESTIAALLASRWWTLPNDVVAALPYDDVPASLAAIAKIRAAGGAKAKAGAA